MRKSDVYVNAAVRFVEQDRSELPELARELRLWVEGQARAIAEIGPVDRLRCLAYVTLPGYGGESISCEFVLPRRRSHTITIVTGAPTHLIGFTPRTPSLGAALALLALLARKVGVAVTLQT